MKDLNEDGMNQIANWLEKKPDSSVLVQAIIVMNLASRGATSEESAISEEEAEQMEDFIVEAIGRFDLLCLVLAKMVSFEMKDGECFASLTDSGFAAGVTELN